MRFKDKLAELSNADLHTWTLPTCGRLVRLPWDFRSDPLARNGDFRIETLTSTRDTHTSLAMKCRWCGVRYSSK